LNSNSNPGVIERAFQIAKSGEVVSIEALQAQLLKEGYANVALALTGRALRQQLTRMIAEAR
jgi:hypothetical protein